MVDTLPGGPASTGTSHPATADVPAARDIAKISDIAEGIRQTEMASQNEQGYFFRGVAIFLAIAIVFWIVVIGLIHLL
jgi:hypothetical protein